MSAPAFSLFPIQKNLEYILHYESGLKIMVYPLMIFQFEPEENELHFFGQIFGLWYAFETSGYQDHQQPFLNKALNWYAGLKMWPQMQLTLNDPRAARVTNAN